MLPSAIVLSTVIKANWEEQMVQAKLNNKKSKAKMNLRRFSVASSFLAGAVVEDGNTGMALATLV
jgi:hypothetical protein